MLLRRYINLTFEQDFKEERKDGSNYESIAFKIHDKLVKAEIFEVTVEEDLNSASIEKLKGCHFAVFVFDISNNKGFQRLEKIKKAFTKDCSINKKNIGILVGNKADLEDKRKVSIKDGEELHKKL